MHSGGSGPGVRLTHAAALCITNSVAENELLTMSWKQRLHRSIAVNLTTTLKPLM